MKAVNLFFSFFLFSLVACSPRVMTDLVKTYPDMVSVDSVVVFEPGETIPNTAESLGRIAVVDRGTSTKCKYDQVLRLACEQTGKAGGNGLAITKHLKPSLWGSSCHQITGIMIRLKDMDIDTLKANSVQESIELSSRTTQEMQAKRTPPFNTIEASVGYSWITSKLYSSTGEKYKKKGGLEWKLVYDRVFKNGLGFGVLYSGFHASFLEGNMKLSYIAPAFVGRTRIDNWIVKYAIGCGLFIYDDDYWHANCFGFHVEAGCEYRLTKNIGIGLSLNAISGTLPKQEGVELRKDESSGIVRVNLLGGLRFYF
ncbi:hypothetical protein [Parabacteroides pacaensis]|uniref:hypothetical protein n=1 Tax=Parabacteroides pacaensis TaxID=2086575 RepID=UPI000D108097|nr:hypothetical protein [Parabacteroides pacaensis]